MPGDGGDALFDWLTVRAVLDGADPYAPLSELGASYGLGMVDLPHPRLPGALLLQLPFALIPLDLVVFTVRLAVIGALVGAWRLARPAWWLTLAVVPAAWHGLAYANLSAVVTLLVAVAVVRGSGVAAGAAAVLRAWPWFLGVVFLVTGRWKAAAVSAVAFVGLNTAGLLLPGVTFDGAMSALVASGEHVGNPSNVGVPLWVAVPAAVGFLIVVYRRRDWVSFGAVPALMLSPVVWLHYLTAVGVVSSERTDKRLPRPPEPLDSGHAQPAVKHIDAGDGHASGV